MLRDPSLAQKCKQHLREDLVKAEHAVIAEIRRMIQTLHGIKQKLRRNGGMQNR
jgi:phosphoenolpyruvate-protein kinase (PTS system EI component)